MVIAPRHDCSTGWRTQRRCVEVVVAQAIFRKAVNVRRIRQAAEGPQMSKARVVEQEYNDVGRAGRWFGLGGPPFLGFSIRFGDFSFKFLAVLFEGF